MAAATSPCTSAHDEAWNSVSGLGSKGRAELQAAGLTPATADVLVRMGYRDTPQDMFVINVMGGDDEGDDALWQLREALRDSRSLGLPPIQAAKVRAMVGVDHGDALAPLSTGNGEGPSEASAQARPASPSGESPPLGSPSTTHALGRNSSSSAPSHTVDGNDAPSPVTWDQLLNISSDGKAELQAAGATPATAQVLQALGYTQAGDLRFISGQLLSQCLGLPPYHTARLVAAVAAAGGGGGGTAPLPQGTLHQLLPPDVFAKAKSLTKGSEGFAREVPALVDRLCMGCGGVAGLVALLSSKDSAAAAQAAWALRSLAGSGVEAKDSVVALGGVAPLLALLSGHGSSGDVQEQAGDVQEQAAGALASIMQNNRTCVYRLIEAGGGERLVACLSSVSASAALEEVVLALRVMVTRLASDGWIEKVLELAPFAPLARLLSSDAPGVRQQAGQLLCTSVGRYGGMSDSAVRAVQAPLMRLLRSDCEGEQAKGAEVVAWLLEASDLTEELTRAGAVQCLLAMLSSDAAATQELAGRAMRAFAKYSSPYDFDAQAYLVNRGALHPLMALLSHGSPAAQEHASEALRALMAGSEDVKERLVQEGIIPKLVAMLSSPVYGTHSAALVALTKLVDGEGEHAADVAAAGAIPPLVALMVLPDGATRVQERLRAHVANLLVQLMKGEEERTAEVAAAGAIAPLVQMLPGEFRQSAVAALGRLAAGSEQRRASIIAAGGEDAISC